MLNNIHIMCKSSVRFKRHGPPPTTRALKTYILFNFKKARTPFKTVTASKDSRIEICVLEPPLHLPTSQYCVA